MHFIYITTNKNNSVIYTGTTSELKQRIYQHKEKMVDGFTKKYNVDKLVYYEAIEDRNSALAREKQIKGWRREKKMHIVLSMNPNLFDLYETLDQ
ncbi:GIY-YIG nuclease family protein [Candidatus Uhrbacteria bacterium]|nr:GIY-YIG nuclease family protein [Candidatus Uhrbacteria bacterium]MBT7716778.1 GIY-YIG nuclease family protein [Candidatus Uhrbacteria bacterium]